MSIESKKEMTFEEIASKIVGETMSLVANAIQDIDVDDDFYQYKDSYYVRFNFLIIKYGKRGDTIKLATKEILEVKKIAEEVMRKYGYTEYTQVNYDFLDNRLYAYANKGDNDD